MSDFLNAEAAHEIACAAMAALQRAVPLEAEPEVNERQKAALNAFERAACELARAFPLDERRMAMFENLVGRWIDENEDYFTAAEDRPDAA
jgi:hypothetical protein